jgi:Skp family chaperone for outer membrane proteins
VLKRVDPDTFARDLAAVKQPSEIDGLFTGSLRSGDMEFVGGSGTLSFADGVLQAKPLAIIGQGLTGEARFLLEAASGDVDLSFTLSLAGQHTIPSFELAYAGSPRALEPSTDAQSLRSFLSMRMLQTSVQQLEELQRQERELIEAEKKFQREQEERERRRREQAQREADRKLDRKQRELADRLRAQEREAREREVEQYKADREVAERQPGPVLEPEATVEPEPDPEPAAAPSDPVTVEPLTAPVTGESTSGAALSVSVPVPRFKPEPDAAGIEALIEPLRLPPSGNLGRIDAPVFSGPAVRPPDPGSQSSGTDRTAR